MNHANDHVDRILSQWQHERPELDSLAMSIFGRLWRLNAIASKAVERVHLEFGLTQAGFDVLATLRRSGEPYTLSPTALYTSLMLSSGAMTNRLINWKRVVLSSGNHHRKIAAVCWLP